MTTTLTAGQKAAITRRANLARLADGNESAPTLTSPDGTKFELGKNCISCMVPQVAFPEDQLPNTSPRYPQCSECLKYERRRIARIAASRESN